MSYNDFVVSAQQPTVDEWFSLPPMQLLQSSAQHPSTAAHVYTAQLNPTNEFYLSPGIKDEYLVITLWGTHHFQLRTEDQKLIEVSVPTHTMQIVPRNLRIAGRWEGTSQAAYIRIPRPLTEELIALAGRGDPDKVEIPFQWNVRDPFLLQMSIMLTKQISDPTPFSTLYIESGIDIVALHLLSYYANGVQLHKMKTGMLTAQQQRTVEMYVQENMEAHIAVSDLAKALHLSTSHFQRKFRATFQCNPYEYILQRRINKAKTLLTTSTLSIQEVAHECGFADQSHFTRHFSRMEHISPARFAARRRRVM